MIHELRTFSLNTRSLSKAEDLLAERYAAEGRPAELLGSFHSEVGPLNRIIQLSQFDDIGHWHRVRHGGAASHAAFDRHVVAVACELMAPTAISPALEPGAPGPLYELREYGVPLGELDRLIDAWRRAMPLRDVLGSPVAAIWTPLTGPLNRLVHLWPYKSFAERASIRDKVRLTGKWPPYRLDEAEGGPGYEISSQVNLLMRPAAFSPLQ